MKKVADPDRQSALRDFADRHGPDDWRRIRDAVLPAFHRGVENQLDEIGERDSTGIREPVNVAIDITYWLFWSSLFRDEENVDFVEEPVTIDYKDGSTREVYPKEDYPEMVSGLKDSHRCGYKFATITTIAEDTPIILGIEPVRDRRGWDLETRTRGELVDRLLEQAEQHVDINKVYADREFDSYEVRHVIDQPTTST